MKVLFEINHFELNEYTKLVYFWIFVLTRNLSKYDFISKIISPVIFVFSQYMVNKGSKRSRRFVRVATLRQVIKSNVSKRTQLSINSINYCVSRHLLPGQPPPDNNPESTTPGGHPTPWTSTPKDNHPQGQLPPDSCPVGGCPRG